MAKVRRTSRRPPKKGLKVRPDSKGRIALGVLAEGVSSYVVRPMGDGRVMLEPQVEIPAREKWLFDNPKALASVRAGLEQAARGEVREIGDFSRHVDDD
jgi:hypothetical protein